MNRQLSPKKPQQPLFKPVTSVIQAIEIIEGDCESASIPQAFQYLIDTGIVWTLQGWYGRTATDLINAGICKRASNS
jgi:hypothetical protein